ncbi:hypothetical protein CW751_13675 [Brumimicrobium salinarum]|uniref:SiaC family regulatory phosphoprotein domain-containing protein n=1 Tax=Brumimicrobium salinarum TaxID=2058658 RepID=A0A2I0QZB9_9FLAO|nr:DUF1987 domain-containing protein [Brumimicrobium salinarum]PKR79684.1 hypothetical protein CW751_13675 [Brumimicrobium salinarum]
MQRLKIDPTASSFFVDLNADTGIFNFQGESRPENAPSFFEPIIAWLITYRNTIEKDKDSHHLKVIFKLDYFNSTSTKYIVDIAKLLKSIDDLPNVNLATEWFYKSIDEDIRDSGNELIDWTGLKIKLIPYD